jgi:hypothetical protein
MHLIRWTTLALLVRRIKNIIRMNDEIVSLDNRAFEMAAAVASDRSKRLDFLFEALRLRSQLVALAIQLERENSIAFEKHSYQISEAMKDFDFVVAPSSPVSERLRMLFGLSKDL